MRGQLSAFDAKNGKLVWRTWMTPDPTQLPYILTWANPAEAAVGGAPIWSVPTYDPKDRLVFQGTGNTYPYLGRQPGKNLWATSIIAINVDTGAIKWYYQPIHHDEWDYDCPHNPTVFNAIVKGKLTPGRRGRVQELVRLLPQPQERGLHLRVPRGEELDAAGLHGRR